jgi:hypothetical protein
MKETERAVSYYDLFIESRVRGEVDPHPRPVPLGAALDMAFEQWGGRPFSMDRATVKVTLADWQRNTQRREHHLIINRADASLPDIPLRHLVTDATRMAGKQPREGIDLTCHILIRERPQRASPALLLMTNGSSLSSDRVCKILSSLFRASSHEGASAEHFRREHPSGEAGKTVALRSNFAVGAHQNATLADLLNGAHLEGLDLISEDEQVFDAASPLAVTSVQYKLEQVRAGRIGVGVIQRAIASLRQKGMDPNKVRVRYKPSGGKKAETHTFDIAALETAFVRREMVRFADPIAARYERVEPRVMAALSQLANRERLG